MLNYIILWRPYFYDYYSIIFKSRPNKRSIVKVQCIEIVNISTHKFDKTKPVLKSIGLFYYTIIVRMKSQFVIKKKKKIIPGCLELNTRSKRNIIFCAVGQAIVLCYFRHLIRNTVRTSTLDTVYLPTDKPCRSLFLRHIYNIVCI